MNFSNQQKQWKSLAWRFLTVSMLLILTILFVSGCSDNDDNGTPATSLVSISITPLNPSIVGGTKKFTATGTYSDNTTQDLSATATWSSSNTSVATISKGFATVISAGTTTITATSGSISNATSLTVTAESSGLTSLITTTALHDMIVSGVVNTTGTNRVVILDITTATTYSAGHISGALYCSGTGSIMETRKEGPAKDINMVPTGATVDAFIQKYGIDGNTTIVLTSGDTTEVQAKAASAMLNVTRTYFTLRYWGFPKEKLKVVDGLNFAYKAYHSGYWITGPTSPTVTPSTYSVKNNASLRTDLRSSFSDMIAAAEAGTDAIIDMRSASTAGSYAGVKGSTAGAFSPGSDYTVFEGRVKGAQAMDYKTELLDSSLHYRFLASNTLATKFGNLGSSSTKRTHVY